MFDFLRAKKEDVRIESEPVPIMPELKHFLEPYTSQLKKEYPRCSSFLNNLIRLSNDVKKNVGFLPASYHDSELKLAKMIESLLSLDPIVAKTKVLEWNQTAIEKMEENLIHATRNLERFELNHKQEVVDNFTRLVNQYEWKYGQNREIPTDEEQFAIYLSEIENEKNPDLVFNYFSAVSHLGDKEILGFNDFLSGSDQIANDCSAILNEAIDGFNKQYHNHATWREQIINKLRFQDQSLINILELELGGFDEEEMKLNHISSLLNRLQNLWGAHPITQQGENPQNLRITKDFQRKQHTLERNRNLLLTAKQNLLTHQESIRTALNKLS